MVWSEDDYRLDQAMRCKFTVAVGRRWPRIGIAGVWDDESCEPFVSGPGNRWDGSWSERVEEALVDLGSKSTLGVRVEESCLGWRAGFQASPPARPMGMEASFVSKSSIVNGMVPS